MTNAPPEAESERTRANLDSAIARFPLAVSLLRRSLFRQYLALNVVWASPLLATVAGADQIDFAEAVWFIEPPRGWPERPLATDARATDLGVDRRFVFSPSQIWRRHRLAGVIVRSSRRSEDMIGVRVLAGGLELTAIDGSLMIETYHGLGRILLAQAIPATIAIAAGGRKVGDVVGHRWLDGKPWRIVRVDETGGGTAIVFDTGRSPWTMPWPAVWLPTSGDL